MTVRTWYTFADVEGLPRRTEQRRGTAGRCSAVDIERMSGGVYVTVAADSPRVCLQVFRDMVAPFNIPEEQWGEHADPLTANATRAVSAWAQYMSDTIARRREQAPADSPATF